MIDFAEKEFNEIKEYFPNSSYDSVKNRIDISLTMPPRYYKESNLSEWEIKLCNKNQTGWFDGEYLITIDLNSQKVFELSEKIKSLAKQLGKTFFDLHVNSDGSCCLGIDIENKKMTLTAFIFEKVFPYFSWQAYYAKYKRIPPCGEFSHGDAGKQEAIQDYEKTMTSVDKFGRNKPCLCKSGKKYKKCCFLSDEKKKSYLREFEKNNNL